MPGSVTHLRVRGEVYLGAITFCMTLVGAGRAVGVGGRVWGLCTFNGCTRARVCAPGRRVGAGALLGVGG